MRDRGGASDRNCPGPPVPVLAQVEADQAVPPQLLHRRLQQPEAARHAEEQAERELRAAASPNRRDPGGGAQRAQPEASAAVQAHGAVRFDRLPF